MRHIHLIDTAVASDNPGDEIIVSEARAALEPVLEGAYVTSSSGHDGLGGWSRRHVDAADLVLLLGTNALDPRYRVGKRAIWTLTRRDLPLLEGKVVLLGVGANRDFTKVSWRQKRLLNRLLAPGRPHSVRDALGAKIVQEAGREALNTSCPTLWASVPTEEVPEGPASRVIFTLTRHKAGPEDAEMLRILLDLYDEVWFWPQQPRDGGYLDSLPGQERVRRLAPNLADYDRFLAAAPCDVVGTRLHGTIRGLHHRRRSLVLSIDNRAREIGAETGLPVLARADVAASLADRLRARWPTRLDVPRASIDRFLESLR
ncbi:hypothetical protein E0K89_004520 [Aquicoccus sp. SCR17]|nr:hypothetical protein [Carideicomes alvinocaridis]